MNYHRIWILAWIITALMARSAAVADSLAVAGSAEHLWLLEVEPSANTFKVYHRHQSDDPNLLSPVTQLSGHVGPQAVAAADSRLWLVYTDPMTVQSIRATRSAINGQWDYSPIREATLPAGGKLRALTAGADGPWALLRVETQLQLDRPTTLAADKPWSQPSDMLDLALGLPPGTGFDPAGASTTRQEPEVRNQKSEIRNHPRPPAPPAPRPRDYLLAMQRGKWVVVDLPPDWPHSAPAWMVMLGPTDPSPVLIARPDSQDDSDNPQLWIYRHDHEQWHKQVQPITAGTAVGPLALDGQLVLATRPSAGQNVQVTLTVLRPENASPLGQLTLDIPMAGPWAVASAQMSVALIARQPTEADPSYHWTRMDLLGRVVQEPTELTLRGEQPLARAADYLVLISVMVLSMLMILVFWRRDPRMNQVQLPPTLVLSDFGRRAAAGLIDLLPGTIAAMVIFGIDPWELQQRWPGMQGQEADWQNMQPGVLVIGVFMVHCTISELITTRTLGKALTGLRVASLDGTRPARWQLLVRNLLKVLDLVTYLLLILPLIGPYRQRLGDMVARTIVVMPAPPPETDDEQNPDSENQEEDP